VAAPLVAIAACGSAPPVGVLGAYRLDDGRVVSVRRSSDETLRYRQFDSGKSGRLYHESSDRYVSGPGFSDRAPVRLAVRFERDRDGLARTLLWSPSEERALKGARIGRERWVTFESDGALLAGRLHLPESSGPHPGVVLVHGSGKSAASEWFYNGDFMVAHGIAVLAFDKRGTGRSKGAYTFDFDQLARDVVAAVDFLRAQPEVMADRIGLSGYSQGAWVAPLAASMSGNVRCALVSYGMIESPAEEAWLEMRNILVDNDVSGDDLEDAEALVRAAVEVVAHRFDAGWDEFGALKKAHRDSEWVHHLRDTPVGGLMRYPKWLVKLFGGGKLPPGLRWDYDSTALLDSLEVPMAWFLAEEDRGAPNEQTIPKLRRWNAQGKPYELFLYPGTDHGMLEFHVENGKRVYTGYAPGYFRAEVDAARRLLLPQSVDQWSNPAPAPTGERRAPAAKVRR
jgi:dienelactone hydrolase